MDPQALVGFVARSLVTHPDDVRVNQVEGEAVVMVELSVHDDDVARIIGPNGRTIRAIRQVLFAATGKRKAVLELLNSYKSGSRRRPRSAEE